MKSKHRYNVRVAQRHEIAVEVVSKTASDSFERFWNLLSSTANRQDFRTHSKNYYKVMVEELAKDEEAHLVFASKDGQDLAALLLITHNGTATYLHGGSSDKNKELMAPFLLHAETIKFAKEFGCHTYDLWGTDLEWNAEKSEWQPISGKASAGTSRFKVGFGGEVISYPGTFDLILKPFWYTLYTFIRAIRGGKRAFS
jgi:lipid II:glycine glycyltransferase (peptidoglycan interpeptide bridge formation enzyme)